MLDEILANQSKILAPSKYLKINRDGTIAETTNLKEYLEKKDKKVNIKLDYKYFLFLSVLNAVLYSIY